MTFALTVPCDVRREVRALQRLYMLEALRASLGNVAEAARLLHMDRKTIEKWRTEATLRLVSIGEPHGE